MSQILKKLKQQDQNEQPFRSAPYHNSKLYADTENIKHLRNVAGILYPSSIKSELDAANKEKLDTIYGPFCKRVEKVRPSFVGQAAARFSFDPIKIEKIIRPELEPLKSYSEEQSNWMQKVKFQRDMNRFKVYQPHEIDRRVPYNFHSQTESQKLICTRDRPWRNNMKVKKIWDLDEKLHAKLFREKIDECVCMDDEAMRIVEPLKLNMIERAKVQNLNRSRFALILMIKEHEKLKQSFHDDEFLFNYLKFNPTWKQGPLRGFFAFQHSGLTRQKTVRLAKRNICIHSTRARDSPTSKPYLPISEVEDKPHMKPKRVKRKYPKMNTVVKEPLVPDNIFNLQDWGSIPKSGPESHNCFKDEIVPKTQKSGLVLKLGSELLFKRQWDEDRVDSDDTSSNEGQKRVKLVRPLKRNKVDYKALMKVAPKLKDKNMRTSDDTKFNFNYFTGGKTSRKASIKKVKFDFLNGKSKIGKKRKFIIVRKKKAIGQDGKPRIVENREPTRIGQNEEPRIVKKRKFFIVEDGKPIIVENKVRRRTGQEGKPMIGPDKRKKTDQNIESRIKGSILKSRTGQFEKPTIDTDGRTRIDQNDEPNQVIVKDFTSFRAIDKGDAETPGPGKYDIDRWPDVKHIKRNKYAFNSKADRTDIPENRIPEVPGCGTYSTRPPWQLQLGATPKQGSFGGKQVVLPAFQTRCGDLQMEKCVGCNSAPKQIEYWISNEFGAMCNECYLKESKKYCMFNRVELETFKPARHCSFIHVHSGKKVHPVKSEKTLKTYLKKESYFASFTAGDTLERNMSLMQPLPPVEAEDLSEYIDIIDQMRCCRNTEPAKRNVKALKVWQTKKKKLIARHRLPPKLKELQYVTSEHRRKLSKIPSESDVFDDYQDTPVIFPPLKVSFEKPSYPSYVLNTLDHMGPPMNRTTPSGSENEEDRLDLFGACKEAKKVSDVKMEEVKVEDVGEEGVEEEEVEEPDDIKVEEDEEIAEEAHPFESKCELVKLLHLAGIHEEPKFERDEETDMYATVANKLKKRPIKAKPFPFEAKQLPWFLRNRYLERKAKYDEARLPKRTLKSEAIEEDIEDETPFDAGDQEKSDYAQQPIDKLEHEDRTQEVRKTEHHPEGELIETTQGSEEMIRKTKQSEIGAEEMIRKTMQSRNAAEEMIRKDKQSKNAAEERGSLKNAEVINYKILKTVTRGNGNVPAKPEVAAEITLYKQYRVESEDERCKAVEEKVEQKKRKSIWGPKRLVKDDESCHIKLEFDKYNNLINKNNKFHKIPKPGPISGDIHRKMQMKMFDIEKYTKDPMFYYSDKKLEHIDWYKSKRDRDKPPKTDPLDLCKQYLQEPEEDFNRMMLLDRQTREMAEEDRKKELNRKRFHEVLKKNDTVPETAKLHTRLRQLHCYQRK